MIVDQTDVFVEGILVLGTHDVSKSVSHDSNDHVHEDNHHQEGAGYEGDPK